MKYLSNYVTDPVAVKEAYSKYQQLTGTANDVSELKLTLNAIEHTLYLDAQSQTLVRCKWIGELYTVQYNEGWTICNTIGEVQYRSLSTAVQPWNCRWPEEVSIQVLKVEMQEALSMGQQLTQITKGVQKGVQQLRQLVSTKGGKMLNTGNLNDCIQELDGLSYLDIHSFQAQARSLLGTGPFIADHQNLAQVLQKFGKDWEGLFSASDWYQCVAVNREKGTWEGKRVIVSNGRIQPSWQYNLAITSTRNFSYLIPNVGEIWNGDCSLQVTERIPKANIKIPSDTAFYLALDNAAIDYQSLYPRIDFGASWYVPGGNCIELNKQVNGRKCLYLNNKYQSTRIQTGGTLCAKDSTTANPDTGCSARYMGGYGTSDGVLYTDGFTYSFLFYPDPTSQKGQSYLFSLGYYYNSAWERRFLLQYNDTTGMFKMRSDNNNPFSTQDAGYINKGEWHHVCIVNNGVNSTQNRYYLYVDGRHILTFQNPATLVPQQPYTNPAITIGYQYGNHAAGGYANLRWYNRPLFNNQIIALAQEAKGEN